MVKCEITNVKPHYQTQAQVWPEWYETQDHKYQAQVWPEWYEHNCWLGCVKPDHKYQAQVWPEWYENYLSTRLKYGRCGENYLSTRLKYGRCGKLPKPGSSMAGAVRNTIVDWDVSNQTTVCDNKVVKSTNLK